MLVYKIQKNEKAIVTPDCAPAISMNIQENPKTLVYEVTTGQKGATGPQGEAGPQGPKGDKGLKGDSYFYLKIEDGYLYAYTASDDTLSDNPFEYDAETGLLYYIIDEEQE